MCLDCMKLLIFLLLFICNNGYAQLGYKQNEVVKNMYAKKIINHTTTTSSLKNLQSNITIIDFFGTWCTPCIKALPELKAYKEKYKAKLNVILISSETETKLSSFVKNHKPFEFPIIVDEDNLFTNAFAPASYPYTIILDKNLKILSITNMAGLTDSILRKFMDDDKLSSEPIKMDDSLIAKTNIAPMISTKPKDENAVVALSQRFVYAAKSGEDVATFIESLKELNYDNLLNNLKDDDHKKAFWINLYNAFTNASLHKNPDQYKKRNKFFRAKSFNVAGKLFSLDKIEHGILRKSKIKWSLGYFGKLFPGKVEKQLRVQKLDNRIHFALNCGAKSCPPIAFYNATAINNQLEVATNAFLTGEVLFSEEKNIVQLPVLLSWFRRDFGGKKKIISLLQSKKILPANANPKIKFKKYDWTLYLDNFKA